MTTHPDAGHEPLPSVLTVANPVYGLHAFAIGVGIAGTATVVIGIPFAFAIMGFVTIWLTYRIGKGGLRLRDARRMYAD